VKTYHVTLEFTTQVKGAKALTRVFDLVETILAEHTELVKDEHGVTVEWVYERTEVKR
jgi:hypothetical protein